MNRFASYSYGNLTRVLFNDTLLEEAEFQELTWKGLYFDHCQMNGANFHNTNLNSLDLASNFFEQLLFTKNHIQGVKIAPMQAIAICQGMGIIID